MEITISDDDDQTNSLAIENKMIVHEITTSIRVTEFTNTKNGKKKKKRRNSGRRSYQRNPFCKFMLPKAKKKRNKNKKQIVETIIIEDDDSIIVLSDDDEGVDGGEPSVSKEKLLKENNDNSNQKFQIAENPPTNEYKEFNMASFSELVRSLVPRPMIEPLPEPQPKPLPRLRLRPIVIDGSNVAYGHGHRSAFSSRGIEICCNYFLSRGHNVKVFLPLFRRRHIATKDSHILDKLEAQSLIVYTPSRHLEGKTISSYVDRMMIEYAVETGAVIVSRDNFRDLASESDTFKEVIEQRLLMYTWVDDVILFPNDPLGRYGPKLADFLSFPPGKLKEETV